MKEKIVGICICMLLIAAVVLPAAGAINEKVTQGNNVSENQTGMDFVPGEFIVKVKQDKAFTSPALTALNEKHHVYAHEKVFNNPEGTILDNIYLLHVPLGSDILSIVQEYVSCPDVVYAEPNGRVYLCGIPNDANFSKQWYLDNTGQEFYPGIHGTPDADIDAPEAWDIETGSPDVVIAIVDTGIDYTHPDLASKIWNNTDEIPGNGIDDDHNGYIDDVMGWDFYHNNSNITDGYGHGTFCSGIAAASTNNSVGIAGVAWNCKIMTVRIFDELGNNTWIGDALGIKYAADNGADVISMSWGSIYTMDIMRDAVNYAYGKGVFLCAAAGNNNNATKHYPAAYDNVTAVAATDQNDMKLFLSDYGDWVDIAAPGYLVYSTMPTYHVWMNDPPDSCTQNYSFESGTSAACPIVAGVAALLLSRDPSLTSDEIKTLICQNVDPYNSTQYIGTGRINAQKALAALNQPPTPPSITGPTNGNAGHIYNYTFVSTDPNGDDVNYFIDWGDQTNSSWLGPYPSGQQVMVQHSWDKTGVYLIKAKAKDMFGLESNWSDPFKMNITPIIEFSVEIQGGFGVTATIKNIGDTEITNVQWTVTLTGGLIILGKTKSGSLMPLAPGASKTIKDTPILGFGKTTIKVDVTCAEGKAVTKSATGTVFLFFVLGVKEG